MPVGKQTLGRVINVIGEPVDELGHHRRNAALMPIHRPAPLFDEQSPTRRCRDRHQVIDLIQPFLKGGKIGLFGGAGVARRSSSWSSQQVAKNHGGYSVFGGRGERTRDGQRPVAGDD